MELLQQIESESINNALDKKRLEKSLVFFRLVLPMYNINRFPITGNTFSHTYDDRKIVIVSVSKAVASQSREKSDLFTPYLDRHGLHSWASRWPNIITTISKERFTKQQDRESINNHKIPSKICKKTLYDYT